MARELYVGLRSRADSRAERALLFAENRLRMFSCIEVVNWIVAEVRSRFRGWGRWESHETERQAPWEYHSHNQPDDTRQTNDAQ